MLLVVDLGNTNVVLGLYEGQELVQTFRVATVRSPSFGFVTSTCGFPVPAFSTVIAPSNEVK